MKFIVSIIRVGYRRLDIEVKASTSAEAANRAAGAATSLDFPPEYDYEYQAEIPSPTTKGKKTPRPKGKKDAHS